MSAQCRGHHDIYYNFDSQKEWIELQYELLGCLYHGTMVYSPWCAYHGAYHGIQFIMFYIILDVSQVWNEVTGYTCISFLIRKVLNFFFFLITMLLSSNWERQLIARAIKGLVYQQKKYSSLSLPSSISIQLPFCRVVVIGDCKKNLI